MSDLPTELKYHKQGRFDKTHVISAYGGNDMIGALMVDFDDVDGDETELFAAEVTKRWNEHKRIAELESREDLLSAAIKVLVQTGGGTFAQRYMAACLVYPEDEAQLRADKCSDGHQEQ